MHLDPSLLFAKMTETTVFLIKVYTGVILLNVLIAGALWWTEKLPLFKWLFIFWLSAMFCFLAQGALQQNAIAILIGYSTCFIFTMVESYILSKLIGFRFPLAIFIGIMALGWMLAIVAIYFELSFFWMAIPVCFGVAIPTIWSSIKALSAAPDKLTFSKKLLSVTTLIWGIHMMDFAVVRLIPEALSFGFTMAIFLSIMVAVAAPMTIIESISEDLRKALKVRDEIMSSVSHELRTPMTALKLQLNLMHRLSQVEKPAVAKIVKDADQQVNYLTEMVNNLLDVAQINTGQFMLNISKFDLSSLFQEVITKFQPKIEAARSTLETSMDPQVMISADSLRIEQMLINLLSNALKYAPGSLITIELKRNQNGILVSVKDSGLGIHEEDQKKIFNHFDRAGRSQLEYSRSGLGLGLYITKYLVEAHYGKLTVESAPGQGAKFIIELPEEHLKSHRINS